MSPTSRIILGLGLIAAVAIAAGAAAGDDAPARRNVLIFVADGLRSGMVTPEQAPTMARLRAEGVDLTNSHAMYPTVTTPNASAIATGHKLGDTGDFGNILYIGAPTSPFTPSPFAGVEDDDVLGGLNGLFGGNYLNEETVMSAARKAGYTTAAIGKNGPIGIQDVTQRDGKGTLIIDDQTGWPGGFPIPDDVLADIRAAGLSPQAEDRGLNGSPGTYNMPGVIVPNAQQQDWFTGVATKVVLPRIKAKGAPFFMVFWSRDPDGTQHFQGDSLNTLTPGINGPTSLAAIRNADTDLARILQTLRDLGLADNTDVFVIADHGFSTISKESHTSASARLHFADVPRGRLPRGFVAIDLAAWLKAPLFDGSALPVDFRHGEHPNNDAALIGKDPTHPLIAVAENGGSDLLYLSGPHARALAARTVAWLTRQDYVGAIFVNDALGPIPGALPMSQASLMGLALTPQPSILISFRSFATGCANPELCAVEVSDSAYQQGQGMHGSFSRADTHNFMAVAGPDFRRGFRDPAPVSNADVAPTLAQVLGLNLPAHGKLVGRVMTEALKDGAAADSTRAVIRSKAAANGFVTVLNTQTAAGATYFDAAGDPGRVVGLRP
jgi:arylsulfatase A-like enzyme